MSTATHLIALGSDMRFVAGQLQWRRAIQTGPRIFSRSDSSLPFAATCRRASRSSWWRRFRLSQVDAETLVPALLVYRGMLLPRTAADVIVVPDVSLRAGVLVELDGRGSEPIRLRPTFDPRCSPARDRSGARITPIRRAACTPRWPVCRLQLFDLLARRACARRARSVAARGGGTAARYRALRQPAGPSPPQPLSAPIIRDLWAHQERDAVCGQRGALSPAGVAAEQPHPAFASLDRDERVRINKLASILRFANALDAEHLQKIDGLSDPRRGRRLDSGRSRGKAI